MEKVDNYGNTSLHNASVGRHTEVVCYLLEQGADRDKANKDGFTPLHQAAANGFFDIVKLLMVYGVDLNTRTIIGQLPIEIGGDITEEIKQAIRDEPRRRMDEAPGKRATEQDRHTNTGTSTYAQLGNEQVEEDEPSNKRQRSRKGR